MSKTTNIYFDFEFIDDGRDIVPISLGMCTSAGEELYLEYVFDPARASDWVRENVFPHLSVPSSPGLARCRPRQANASLIETWVSSVCCDSKPKFWGYYPSYDWVLLGQHWGTMMQLPKEWPFRPECLKQLADHLGVEGSEFPDEPKGMHNALVDAKWHRDLHRHLAP